MYLTRLASLHRLTPRSSLLVNALSGAVDLVDEDVRGQLLQLGLGGRAVLEAGHRQALLERGYLFSSQGEERAALRRVFDAYQELARARPLQFVVLPTYACNLSCTYCFEDAALRRRPEVMSGDQAADLFSAIDQLAAPQSGRMCQVVLFGGEPLLPTTQPVVADLVARADAAGFAVQVVTNGTWLERFAPVFARHSGTVRGCQITLDGLQPVHDARRRAANGGGSFEQVVRAVDLCLALEIEVNLRVNLDSQNLGSLEDLVSLLQERGWLGRTGFRCQLAPVTDHSGKTSYPHLMREDELVEPVLELWHRRPELKQTLDFQLFRVLHHLLSVVGGEAQPAALPRFHYCEADRGDVFAFGPDGLIYICPESAGSRRHAVGTYSPRFRLWGRRLKPWRHRSVLALPECQDCAIATFCGGGCGYAAWLQRGSPAHGVCGQTPQVVKSYLGLLRGQIEAGQTALRLPVP